MRDRHVGRHRPQRIAPHAQSGGKTGSHVHGAGTWVTQSVGTRQNRPPSPPSFLGKGDGGLGSDTAAALGPAHPLGFNALVSRQPDFGFAEAFCLRVAAAFLADADRSSGVREADADPPILPPRLLDTFVSGTPLPLPDLFPPPDSLLTVAHARLFASCGGTPRLS